MNENKLYEDKENRRLEMREAIQAYIKTAAAYDMDELSTAQEIEDAINEAESSFQVEMQVS